MPTALSNNFLNAHPDIIVEKKSDSPDEDKSVHDAKLLIPTLKDFFSKHPLINPKTFLGDAAFDAVELYKSLLTGHTFGKDQHFQKAYIPLNARSGLENQDYTINEDGIPCCPHDATLPMKPEGSKSHLKSGLPTLKFVCPKMKWVYEKTTQNLTDNVFVIILAPPQNVVVWFIFILKKTFELIQVSFVERKTGIIHIKSEL